DGHNRRPYCRSFSKVRMAPDRKNPAAPLVLQSRMLCAIHLDDVWPLQNRWKSELKLSASSHLGPPRHRHRLVPREHEHGVDRGFLLEEPQFLVCLAGGRDLVPAELPGFCGRGRPDLDIL